MSSVLLLEMGLVVLCVVYSLVACGSNTLSFTMCTVLLLELMVLCVVYHLEYFLVACGSNKLSFTMCNVLLLELIAWSILLLRVGAINCHLPYAVFSC